MVWYPLFNVSMNKKRLSVIIFTGFIGLNQWVCEDPEIDKAELISTSNNTLGSPSVGNGQTGQVSDYFYNFENDINASFYRFHPSILGYDYEKYYSLFQKDPPAMSFRTFSDYLVTMEPDDAPEYTRRYYIDSLSVQDSIVPDSVLITSTQFKNLELLEWDLDAEPSQQRYQLRNSNWIQSDTMIHYEDIFDLIKRHALVDAEFSLEVAEFSFIYMPLRGN